MIRHLSLVLALGLTSFAQAAPHGILPTFSKLKSPSVLNQTRIGDNASKLVYYGGPVIGNVKIYTVFWGDHVNATVTKGIGDFFSTTVNSTYMDWLSEYNTNLKAVDGREGTQQKIGRGTYVSEIQITPANVKTDLLNEEIQAELDHQIALGKLPKPDANSLYMIFFPPGITIAVDGAKSCQQLCAYHEGFVSPSHGNIFYGVMPDMDGACRLGCGFQPAYFDSVTEVTAHELIEAVTDPFPTPGDKPAYPQAWNTTKGEEIGDLCSAHDTTLTTKGLTYVLQQEFDNQTQACAPGPYQSP